MKKTKTVEKEDLHQECRDEIAQLEEENESLREQNNELYEIISEIKSLVI